MEKDISLRAEENKSRMKDGRVKRVAVNIVHGEHVSDIISVS